MTGAGWTTLGSRGRGVNEFNLPDGIAVDSTGRIYVTDSWNHRIVRMDDMSGEGWTTFGRSGNNVAEFLGPMSIAINEQARN